MTNSHQSVIAQRERALELAKGGVGSWIVDQLGAVVNLIVLAIEEHNRKGLDVFDAYRIVSGSGIGVIPKLYLQIVEMNSDFGCL